MDSPVEAEASQALFCAVADYVGQSNLNKVLNLEEFPTYQSFTGYPLKQSNSQHTKKLTPEQVEHQILINDSFKKTSTPGVDLQRMETFLDSKPDWYESSILTAKAIIEEINKYDKNSKFNFQNLGWQDFFYVRGATSGITAMDNIEKLFAIANASNQYKAKPFGDVNKWSPADIYFVSRAASRHIAYKLAVEMNAEPSGGGKKLKDIFGFDELNLFINGLIETGDLLPVSLKKTKDSATIYPYNFDRDAQEIYFSTIKYYDVSRRKSYKRTPQSASLPYKSVSPVTRDIKIYFNGGKKDKIKIRHDSYHNKFGVNKALKVEIEVTGAGGRGGSFVGFNRLKDIIDDVSPVLGTMLMKKWTAGLKRYEEELDLLNTRFGVARDTPHSFLANKTTPQETIAKKEGFKNQYLEYQAERAHLSALYIDNYIYPVLENWFVFNSVSAQKVAFANILLKRFIEYASSRSPKSGKFVIAK